MLAADANTRELAVKGVQAIEVSENNITDG
jgi:hypothetical protein